MWTNWTCPECGAQEVNGCRCASCGYDFRNWLMEPDPNGFTVFEGEVTPPDGRGTMNLKNGSIYTGSFENGFFHGEGCLRQVDGIVISAIWYEGECLGNVIACFPDGRLYTGEWHNGSMDGQGTIHELDGSWYETTWHNGIPDKHGTVCKDGKIVVL